MTPDYAGGQPTPKQQKLTAIDLRCSGLLHLWTQGSLFRVRVRCGFRLLGRHTINLSGRNFIQAMPFQLECREVEPEFFFQNSMSRLQNLFCCIGALADTDMRRKDVPPARQSPPMNVVYVLDARKFGKTRRDTMRRSIEQLTTVGAPFTGCIMNNLSANAAGYGYSYYYYRSPYLEDEPPKKPTKLAG